MLIGNFCRLPNCWWFFYKPLYTYTGWQLRSPRYILDVLWYQYYTSVKATIIFLWFYEGWIRFSQFWGGIQGYHFNFLSITPIFSNLIWKVYGLLTRKTMKLREKFSLASIPGQNGGLSKFSPVVKLWQAVFSNRIHVQICKLHYCFCFKLPFQTM